jgi:hypothetical protein
MAGRQHGHRAGLVRHPPAQRRLADAEATGRGRDAEDLASLAGEGRGEAGEGSGEDARGRGRARGIPNMFEQRRATESAS